MKYFRLSRNAEYARGKPFSGREKIRESVPCSTFQDFPAQGDKKVKH
jgi:hypothetical protein